MCQGLAAKRGPLRKVVELFVFDFAAKAAKRV